MYLLVQNVNWSTKIKTSNSPNNILSTILFYENGIQAWMIIYFERFSEN
jgi:hypothetical protein